MPTPKSSSCQKTNLETSKDFGLFTRSLAKIALLETKAKEDKDNPTAMLGLVILQSKISLLDK